MKSVPPRFMQKLLLVVALSLALLVEGCGQKEEAAPATIAQELKDANARADKAEQSRDRYEIERQQALKENQKKDHQLQEIAAAAKSNERLAWILGVFVVISLFIGIGIGSSARKNSSSKDSNSD